MVGTTATLQSPARHAIRDLRAQIWRCRGRPSDGHFRLCPNEMLTRLSLSYRGSSSIMTTVSHAASQPRRHIEDNLFADETAFVKSTGASGAA